MSKLKGQSINEKLHNREVELRQEGRQEERINVMNTIETLENQGKTPNEIITTLKNKF